MASKTLLISALASASVALFACSDDNKYDQGVDDTGYGTLPNDDDTGTGGMPGGTTGPGGDDTDSDTTIDETTPPDTDTTVDETTGGTDPESCNHPYEPVDVVGASKTFSVSADGAVGEENISIIGTAGD